MAVGLGLSIGTVNSVTALADTASAKAPPGLLGHRRHARPTPSVTRRTTLSFDSTGSARVGLIPRHGRAITEFADLGRRDGTTARVGQRTLRPADLVAVVTDCLITEAMSDRRAVGAEVALTHPANYGPDELAELRGALDAIGLHHVALVAEPVAAAAWLEEERGPLMPGLALVYDLGGASLDVTLVRVGAGRPRDPIVGVPLRSADFGGRAFGALLAARGSGASPMAGSANVLADESRAEHARASLELVYRCLRTADVTMADVDCVLVVGGAARPPEVSGVLATQLARPVVVAPDPERTTADGAALLARTAAFAAESAQRRNKGLLRTRRKLTRVASVAALSAGGVALAFAPTADGAVAGSAPLGLF
ncbi:molecular chaperone HscA [Nocardia amikacinitolerans]|uniref:Hsp70 family protein n=1 Tax=Nocardia amikacinitolerans TaxID=756689 RepID=UPI00082ACB3E|nr:Hsp70 family protein [Nocardia amikacinitolerans]MCP2318823.1 molecular chaperone HscA [Nocardia amikacinitolerans]